MPFETLTAPWIAGDRLAAHLNAEQLPGVRFEPISADPSEARREGVRLVLTDKRLFQPATTAIYLLTQCRGDSPSSLSAVETLPPRASCTPRRAGAGRRSISCGGPMSSGWPWGAATRRIGSSPDGLAASTGLR